MGDESIMQSNKLPEIIVFAGPNGSGKSTVTSLAKVIPPYINADDIKRTTGCTDLEAAQLATSLREKSVESSTSFTFETVLSTERNLNLLKRAKKAGFFICCIYVLTANVAINIMRVHSRAADGGHDVPVDKIKSRYVKALNLVPELVKVCDVMRIYDNSNERPYRIFKKRKEEIFFWENEDWDMGQIHNLVGV